MSNPLTERVLFCISEILLGSLRFMSRMRKAEPVVMKSAIFDTETVSCIDKILLSV